MKHSQLLYTLVLALASQLCLAQQPTLNAPRDVVNGAAATSSSDSASSTAVAEVSNGTSVGASTWRTNFERWVDLNELSFSARYRNEAYADGFHGLDNGQQRSLIDGAFKFDRQGRYKVGFHVSSGRSFNWAYTIQINPDSEERSSASFAYLSPLQRERIFSALAVDPLGVPGVPSLHSRGFEMYFRQLYLSATPVDPVTLEYGGLKINHGVGTEATTYDDDGYISGERIAIHAPKLLHVDEISFTNAYEGDIFVVNFFDRADRLTEANYRQLQVIKAFNSHIKTSADYTFDKGTHTLRQAVLVNLPKAAFIDSARVEFYQRLNDHVLFGQNFERGQGVAFTGSKTFDKRFQIEGGYANIDLNYGVLTGSRTLAVVGYSMNGDAFLTGERFFARSRLQLTPYLNAFGYYTHEIRPSGPTGPIVLNGQGITGGITFDIKKLILPKAGM